MDLLPKHNGINNSGGVAFDASSMMTVSKFMVHASFTAFSMSGAARSRSQSKIWASLNIALSLNVPDFQ